MKTVSYAKLVIAITVAMAMFACTNSELQKITEKQLAGMYEETIPALKTMIDKSPGDANAHFLLASAFLNTGDIEQSEARYNSALQLQKTEEAKARIRNNMGQEYKDALFRFLEAGKGNEQYLFEQMQKYANSETLARAEDHLKIFCTNRMNERSYPAAYNGYLYLARLNPGLKEEIAQKHLALFNETNNQKFKSAVIENALKFYQNDSLAKVYANHHYELSKQAVSTEAVIAELIIANKYGNMFKAELQIKQDQLQREKMLELVKKNEEKFGPAKKVKVEKPGDSFLAITLTGRTRFYYVATNDFLLDEGEGGEETDKSVTSVHILEFRRNGKTDLYISYDKNPAYIYFWTEKI